MGGTYLWKMRFHTSYGWHGGRCTGDWTESKCGGGSAPSRLPSCRAATIYGASRLLCPCRLSDMPSSSVLVSLRALSPSLDWCACLSVGRLVHPKPHPYALGHCTVSIYGLFVVPFYLVDVAYWHQSEP